MDGSRLRLQGVLGAGLVVCLLLCSAVHSVAGESAGFALGPGDIIDVSVWKDEALTQRILVRPDGRISFPLIGDVQAAGQTVDQVRAAIQKRIREFIPDAPVAVMLAQLASNRFFVVGKVKNPGEYRMPGRTRVLQALAMAGGLTSFADGESILVLRETSGVERAMSFDYEAALDGKHLENNVVLQPGDTIVVP